MYKHKGSKYKRQYGMTLEKLAEKLNVSAMTIQKWEKQGFDIYKKAQDVNVFREFPEIAALWSSMCDRCGNPNSPSYKYYGGKGIKILMEKRDLICLWVKYEAHKMVSPSIHRKDKNGHYEFNNCIMVEMEEHHKISAMERNNLTM